tara:strand:+ start:1943 stop:2866 length:924 start_codon:yes stop_codon:yes gene_type:complete
MNDFLKKLIINLENDGKRLDNIMFLLAKRTPKSLIYKLIRKGRIKVDGKKSNPSTKLKAGDIIDFPSYLESEPNKISPPKGLITLVNDSVLYENEDVLLINKPSGLGSHSGTGLKFGLIELARHARKRILKLDLVHRLDRDTSGCLLLSKNLITLRELHEIWSTKKVEKIYIALFKGRVRKNLTRIEVNLETARGALGEKRAFALGQKRALTSILEKKYIKDNTLVTLRLDTGRMHQIRAHARYIGHPLAGDDKYGDRDFNKALKKEGLSRLFLHASRIKIYSEKLKIDVEAPLPIELGKVLSNFEQ